MRSIFIRSAELGSPFTDHPVLSLRDNMQEAASKAVAAAGLVEEDIDALYVAAMGSFTQEHFLGALPLWLAGQLGLRRAYLAPMLSGSSETGAWALRSAFEVMRRGDRRSRHVLVVAGEQMNALPDSAPRTPEARFEERRARNMTISQVVDELDRLYGLNMLRLSDLIMDTLAQADGLGRDALRDIVLPFIALEKYARVKRYPYGQFAAKAPLRGPDGPLAAYLARPPLTPYFRLDDVAPTTSGAVAVVLSASPTATQRPLQILGMGQGFVPSSIMWRRGSAWRSRAIRDALRGACEDAQVSPEWMLSCDFALIHDAFPAIEYFFLRELGLKPEEIIRRMISGWSNPLGGLRACGHALGASGLLQVAKAFHLIQQDPRYVTDADLSGISPFPGDLGAPPYTRCFTTSVGGALTNVLATILWSPPDVAPGEAQPTPPPQPLQPPQPTQGRVIERPPSVELPTMRGLRAQVTPLDVACEGQVLAGTRLHYSATFGDDARPMFGDVRDPWVYLVALDPDPARATALDRTLAYAPQPYHAGDRVALEPMRFPGQPVPCMKVASLLAASPPSPAPSGLSDAFLADLRARLMERYGSAP
jgi:acetyl-CoA C-acetyltransferase